MPNLEHLIIRKSKMAAPTGKLKYAYETIYAMEAKIKSLEKNMCIYAREEMGDIDFDSDKDVIKYFADFAAAHE